MVIYENLNFSLPQNTRYKRYAICEPVDFNEEWVKYRNPIGIWLDELQSSVEVECLSAMQAKSVATTPESFEGLSIRNSHISIQRVRKVSVEIINNIDSFIDLLPVTSEDLLCLKKEFSSIGYKICEIIEICRRTGCDYTTNKVKCSVAVASLCKNIVKFINVFIDKKSVNNPQLEATLRKLKETFGEMVDRTIRKECQVIISSLHNQSSHLCLKWSLLAFWQLTQNDAYICRIFAEDPLVIKRLIHIVTSYSPVSLQLQQQIKAAALRVLTYFCINEDALSQIFKECTSGKCFISYISNESCEMILREAVGLMVQLTAPFIDDIRSLPLNNFNYNEMSNLIIIDEFVQNLTAVARSTCSNEIFLLTCASLANISFRDVDLIIKWDTIKVLINASKERNNFDEVILKDQIVTILANVARKHPLEIVASGGLVFLLCALQIRSACTVQKHGELVAVERIQQKAAVALARLGSHKSSARLIYKLNGIRRLIELCKNAKERNFSDTVLMACLAAIRRVAHTIGRAAFKELDALDLIDLDFNKACSVYSAKNESFV